MDDRVQRRLRRGAPRRRQRPRLPDRQHEELGLRAGAPARRGGDRGASALALAASLPRRATRRRARSRSRSRSAAGIGSRSTASRTRTPSSPAGGERRTTRSSPRDGARERSRPASRSSSSSRPPARRSQASRATRFTTLAETDDRILATAIDARWRYGARRASTSARAGRTPRGGGCSRRSPRTTAARSSTRSTRWARRCSSAAGGRGDPAAAAEPPPPAGRPGRRSASTTRTSSSSRPPSRTASWRGRCAAPDPAVRECGRTTRVARARPRRAVETPLGFGLVHRAAVDRAQEVVEQALAGRGVVEDVADERRLRRLVDEVRAAARRPASSPSRKKA